MSMMQRILRLMSEKKASDVYLSPGSPALIKINGQCLPVNPQPLARDAVPRLLAEVLPPERVEELEETGELNMAIPMEGVGNFRISGMRQKGLYSAVIRFISPNVPTIESLNVPPILADLVMEKRGLILVVGATGAGKSTTLASMLDHRNARQSGHILTIEDPVEFLLTHKKSVINQREVGSDTSSMQMALKNALRQAPDVIMIGEIRDRNTMKQAIAYAETGHLCLSTLHANNANQAMERVINFFPEEAHRQLLVDLSLNLAGVVSQRLIPGLHEKLVPAVEVMLNSSYISDLIAKGEFSGIKEAMARSTEIGMCTFDQALYQLYTEDRISLDEALHNADSRTDLALRVRLAAGVSTQDVGDLSIDTSSPIQSAARLA